MNILISLVFSNKKYNLNIKKFFSNKMVEPNCNIFLFQNNHMMKFLNAPNFNGCYIN